MVKTIQILTISLLFLLQSQLRSQTIKLITADGLPVVKTKILNDSFKIVKNSVSSYILLGTELKPFSKAYAISLGYDTASFIVPGIGDTLELILYPTSELLKTVVITSSKGEKPYRDITSSLIQVKPYLIEERNNTELTEVINQIPSVNIIDNQASIRGGSGWSYGSGSRVMVTVDGLPMLSGDANQVQWQFLDMQNIKSIEVMKGASSVLYGSSALNGVININTNRSTDTFIGEINTYFGVYDNPSNDSLIWRKERLKKYGINAFTSFKLNKTNVILSTVNVRDEGYRMGDEGNRTRLGLDLSNQIKDSLNVGLKVTAMRNTGSTFLLWESDALGYTALDSSFNENISTRLAIDPSVTFVGKSLKHQLLARFFWLKNDIYQSDTLSDQSNSSQFNYMEYRASSQSLVPGFNTIGGLVKNWSRTQSPLFQGSQNANNNAVYLQLEKRIQKLFLNAGLRYEQFKLNNRTEAKPIFKAGVTYTPFKYSIFRASYGEGFRFPSIAESFISTSVGPVSIYPNNELEAESSWNAEIGVKQGVRFKKINIFIDAAYYYTRINNMVEFTFGQWSQLNTPANNFGFGFKSINAGNAEISGVDLNLIGNYYLGKNKFKFLIGYVSSTARHLDFEKQLGIDSGSRPYSYKSTSSDTISKLLKYRPIHSLKADIQWDRAGWSMGLSARYNSFINNIDRAFVEFPISFVVPGIQEQRNNAKNGNLIVDLRLSKKWNHRFKTAIIINNMFNNLVMERPADFQAPRYFMFQISKKL